MDPQRQQTLWAIAWEITGSHRGRMTYTVLAVPHYGN